MKIKRADLLDDLLMVKPGLSSKEYLEQSTSFVFRDKTVTTFNDEISCRKATTLDITGAVPSASLLSILEKLTDDDLDVTENDKGELVFKGKRKSFGVLKEAEILLPLDKIEEEIPTKWRRLPANFQEIIGKVRDCVGTEEGNFRLTCIHLHPEYIEACDNRQALRWRTTLKLKRPLLVRGDAISKILQLGVSVTEFAPSKSWIHFRNSKGVIFSCRKFLEDFPALDSILKIKGHDVILPKALIDASDRAAVFASEQTASVDAVISVSLMRDKIRVVGTGLIGWYREVRKTEYRGPEMEFIIVPGLLKYVASEYREAQVSDNKLKASGGSDKDGAGWDYVTVLGRPRTAEPEPAEPEEKPATKKQKAKPVPDDEEDVAF